MNVAQVCFCFVLSVAVARTANPFILLFVTCVLYWMINFINIATKNTNDKTGG